MRETTMISPARRMLLEAYPLFYPYRNTPPHNLLEGFDSQLEVDKIVKVLYLSCSDLRNALAPSSMIQRALQVYVNDGCHATIARHIFLLKVICQQRFNPEDEQDLSYIWSIWYDSFWVEASRKRFTEDLKDLIENGLPDGIAFLEENNRQQKEKVVTVWKQWLEALNKTSVFKIKEQRSDFIADGWRYQGERGSCCWELPGGPLSNLVPEQASFVKELGPAMQRLDLTLNFSNFPTSLRMQIAKETREYYVTGNCSVRKISPSQKFACANPTMLDPSTKAWRVQCNSCPLFGYDLLPMGELDNPPQEEGTVTQYCRAELANLLATFRQRREEIKFFFHIGDPLAFCYYHIPAELEFDIIESSTLADEVGLVNVLGAAGRRLADPHTSVLVTESLFWDYFGQSSVLEHVKESLCCPSLSLIPTLYGLRLASPVELGSEIPYTPFAFSRMSSPAVLRWEKAPDLEGMPLSLSSTLEKCLEQLASKCFPSFLGSYDLREHNKWPACFYTQFTYDYVVNDLARRCSGVARRRWMDAGLSGLAPAYRRALQTAKAWTEGRPVARVAALFNLDQFRHHCCFKPVNRINMMALRLVLFPEDDKYSILGADPEAGRFERWKNFHFFDNLDVTITKGKSKAYGNIEVAEVSFLLEDPESLIETHRAVLADIKTDNVAMDFGKKLVIKEEVVNDLPPHPYFPFDVPPASQQQAAQPAGRPHLKAESCYESAKQYNVRVSLHNLDSKDPSGLKVVTDELAPCESVHRVTVSLTKVKPITLYFPHPVMAGNIRATLRRKERFIELDLDKALTEPCPAEFGRSVGTRWNADAFPPFSDACHPLDHHLRVQFHIDAEKEGRGDKKGEHGKVSALDEVRRLIRAMFIKATSEGRQFFQVKVARKEQADWFIIAHLPVLCSPLKTPLIPLTAHDSLLADGPLIGKEKWLEDFRRIGADFTNRGAKPQTLILKSQEAARLFRYVLRLNSTRILPNSWQRGNLPDGGFACDTPWLVTFISPLYLDRPFNEEYFQAFPILDAMSGVKKCAQCGTSSREKDLKRCSRCKSVTYCSAECQKAGWSYHKDHCYDRYSN